MRNDERVFFRIVKLDGRAKIDWLGCHFGMYTL